MYNCEGMGEGRVKMTDMVMVDRSCKGLNG